MSENLLLNVTRLSTYFYVYEGIMRVLDEISFQIRPREIFGLVGESGSGKTVASLSILRLILPPGRITSGEVIFEGTDLLKLPQKEFSRIRGKKISMIFQQSRTALNPFMKIGEQIARIYRTHEGLSKSEAMEKAIYSLKRFRIPEAEKRVESYPHEFSLGMAQRVMIAMMMACNPRLLIADEPTTGLDVTTQAQILDLMKEARDEMGTSILLITHDLGVAAQTCDRVAVMHAGHIVEIADVEVLYERPLHPYTQALLRSIPRVDKKVRISDIPGFVPSLLNPPRGCRFANRCTKVIQGVCEKIKPKTIEIDRGHLVMCHLYGGS